MTIHYLLTGLVLILFVLMAIGLIRWIIAKVDGGNKKSGPDSN